MNSIQNDWPFDLRDLPMQRRPIPPSPPLTQFHSIRHDEKKENDEKGKEDEGNALPVLVLRTRVRLEGPEGSGPHVSWAPDVVERKNQKTSKKCCVFHPAWKLSNHEIENSDQEEEEERMGKNQKERMPDVEGRAHPVCSRAACFCDTTLP